jgi:molecular chaperone GrpE
MSDEPPPRLPSDAAVADPQALSKPALPPPATPAEAAPHVQGTDGAGHNAGAASPVEAVLADFRRWLQAEAPEPAAPSGLPDVPAIDLHTVLSHFVALRQEVNLQTRSVRSQQEQNAALLEQLQRALEVLAQSQARAEQSQQQGQEEHVRPLLNTLVDLYDSLALAGREIQKSQAALKPLLEQAVADDGKDEAPLPSAPAGRPSSRSFWSRWRLTPSAADLLRASQEETQKAFEQMRSERAARRERHRQACEACARVEEALISLVDGYTMSIQRIDRALRQHGLEPIATVGEVFDPEQMEVLEAVRDSGRPANQVVEEVRRGYLWNGRVFRYALVRVAR